MTPVINEPKRALIFGIGGQDGAYLARLLLDKGTAVHGTSRDIEVASFDGLKQLGLLGRVRLYSANLGDFRSVAQVLRQVEPDEVYNLAAQSSVGLSFEQPIETANSIINATLNVLEAIRFLGGKPRFYNASSSEMFGDTGAAAAADELTPFRPASPYGVSKAAAHWMVASYRRAYGLYACSGILFNHESPLRRERFVTQKIVRAAVDIHLGAARRLTLGNIAVTRDFGYAPDYVEAMWLMLQQKDADDFVIATGKPATLQDFVAAAFGRLKLDWKAHVDIDKGLMRPYEVDRTVGNPAKAAQTLNWRARTAMPELVAKLVDAELERRGTRSQE